MKIARYVNIALFLVSAFFAGSATADLFCSNACGLEIDFVNGGSIEAIEPVTMTFGDGGLIDTGSTSTAYVAGDTLVLAGGERLVFAAGGQLRLGSGGNIDATSVIINVDGNALLGDTAGGEVTLWSGSALSIQNGGGLTVNSPLTVAGTLDLSGGVLQPGSVGTVTLNPTGNIDVGANSFVINSISSITPTVVSVGTTSLTVLTIDDLGILQGFEMPTANGGNCTIQDEVCIDSQGQRYALVEGQFVAVDDSAGSSGLFDWIMLSGLLLLLPQTTRRAVIA